MNIAGCDRLIAVKVCDRSTSKIVRSHCWLIWVEMREIYIQLEREGLVALTIEAVTMAHFLLAGALLITGG